MEDALIVVVAALMKRSPGPEEMMVEEALMFPVAFKTSEIVEEAWEMRPLTVASPVPVIVPMFTRLPEESMRWVPAPEPVLIPVVPLSVVPVMVEAAMMVDEAEMLPCTLS